MIVATVMPRTIIEAIIAMTIIAMVPVVFEGMERATHVVADEILVCAPDVRGRRIDEVAAVVGEPAIDAHVYGDRGRGAADRDRRIEGELQRRVRRAPVGKRRAVEGAFRANARVGELRMCGEECRIRDSCESSQCAAH